MALTIELKEGSHTIEYRKTDYETVSFSIDVTAGQPETYTKSLDPKPGSIRVNCNIALATTTIIETGESGTTTHTFENVEPGSYTIRCEKSGYLTDEKTVDLSANEDASVSFTLEERNPSGRIYNCSISPGTVNPGDSATVDFSVENDGNINIEYTVAAYYNGGKLNATTEKLESGQSTSSSLNIPAPDVDGTVDISLQLEWPEGTLDSCTVSLTVEKFAEITFESSPSNATVYIDGKRAGET